MSPHVPMMGRALTGVRTRTRAHCHCAPWGGVGAIIQLQKAMRTPRDARKKSNVDPRLPKRERALRTPSEQDGVQKEKRASRFITAPGRALRVIGGGPGPPWAPAANPPTCHLHPLTPM